MNKTSETPVTVIFRVFKDTGAVVAMMPFQREGYGMCQTYSFDNGHSIASYAEFLKLTRPANGEEYAALGIEMQNQGYKLRVRKKFVSYKGGE